MALNPNPPPVLCVDYRRHDHPGRNPLPQATVLVRFTGGKALEGRCDGCFRSLDAASPDAILVDAYELGPARTTARYDADTAI